MNEDEAHPLVATPSILARGARYPGPAGQRMPTGVFSRRGLDTMVAIAEALFSTDERPCPPERLAWVERELADLMSRAAPRGRFTFQLGAFAVSVVAPILVGRFPPFTKLTLPLRIEALRRLESRPLGVALIALKAVLCMIYFEHPDAAAEVGIVPGGPGGRLL